MHPFKWMQVQWVLRYLLVFLGCRSGRATASIEDGSSLVQRSHIPAFSRRNEVHEAVLPDGGLSALQEVSEENLMETHSLHQPIRGHGAPIRMSFEQPIRMFFEQDPNSSKDLSQGGIANASSIATATVAPTLKPYLIPIPVEYVKHERRRVFQDNDNITGNVISEALGSDLLGDSLEPTDHGHGAKPTEGHPEHHIPHKYMSLLFFILALMYGCMILWALERFAPFVPYTVALFLIGMFIGMGHEIESTYTWKSWCATVQMWESIDPHLFFYGFLPTLIFGEAMRLNAQLVRQCLWQILLLAGPGVLIGTLLTATFCVYVLPYGWDWPIALVFGSICSATDPVAVVALFNTLGVSPRLTMLISGESLLNDGTAMVIFSLMLKVILGASLDFYSVVTFFAHMTITSVLWGALLGYASVFLIGLCAEEKQHSDLVIQVITTICCAYFAFFIAESELSTSGVLATVSSGFVVALQAWPRFVSKEAMDDVWETIGFIGNTIVFFLAGMLFLFNVYTRREYIQIYDVGWLFLLYLVMLLIRSIMILSLYPILNLCGTKISGKEAFVMVWSGLRGAVGLAMAIIVDREPDVPTQMGSRVMFHVGGLAALTLIINATSAAPLLKYLELTSTSEIKQMCLSNMSTRIASDIRKEFEEKMANHEDVRCQGASEHIVRAMVPALTKRISAVRNIYSSNEPSLADDPSYQDNICEIYRRTFLQVVKTHYWEAIEDGMLPKCGPTARLLLESVDEALAHTEKPLHDWRVLEKKIRLSRITDSSFLGRLFGSWPFNLSKDLEALFSKEKQVELVVNVALTFMEVHSRAQREVPDLFPGAATEGTKEDEIDKEASVMVLEESASQFKKAMETLSLLPAADVEVSKSKMFARELLQLQESRIEFMKKKGFLTDMEVKHLEHEIHQAIRVLLHSRNREWSRKVKAGLTVNLAKFQM